MVEYIDKAALVSEIEKNKLMTREPAARRILELIRNMTVFVGVGLNENVAPVRRGHWIEENDCQICSECGEEHEWDEYRAAYCDVCGAEMEVDNG